MSAPAPTTTRLDPGKLLSAAVLAAWAGLFWWLLLSGRWSLFLASRVQWLVPVAAVAFSVGALGQLLTARGPAPSTLTSARAWTAATALAPVLLIAIVPLGTLGSYAAERRTSYSAAQFSVGNPLQPGEPLTFQQLVGASATPEGRAALAQRRGERVSLVGLAMEPAAGRFRLTRFVVSCCVVDATVVDLPVTTAAADPPAAESWVAVDGSLDVAADGGASIAAASVTPTAQPDPPYLHP